MGRRALDIAGQRFGRLTTIARLGTDPASGGILWRFRCDCGNETTSLAHAVVRGGKQSCGCLKRDRLQERNTTHGMSGTPEFHAWCAAIKRCEDPGDKRYHDYGGRGIAMDPAWRESFAQFFADMGNRPSPAHSLGREDNDGPYAAWNCRWETGIQQNANRRISRIFTMDGETMTLTRWAKRLGISLHRLRYQTEDKGRPLADAVIACRSYGKRLPSQHP